MNLATKRPRRNTYYPDYGLPPGWERDLARELDAVDWPREPRVVRVDLGHRPMVRRATRRAPRRARRPTAARVTSSGESDGPPPPVWCSDGGLTGGAP